MLECREGLGRGRGGVKCVGAGSHTPAVTLSVSRGGGGRVGVGGARETPPLVLGAEVTGSLAGARSFRSHFALTFEDRREPRRSLGVFGIVVIV